jgi:hypothetical protein
MMLALAFSLFSCKKAGLADLEYSGMITGDWLQVNVVKKPDKKTVMWFQVFDQKGNDNIIKGYKNSSDKIGKHPASISRDHFIWILVNDRMEIRLIADSSNKDYQNTDKLRDFLLKFDLDGLEKIKGSKVKAKDLEKYLPKLK